MMSIPRISAIFSLCVLFLIEYHRLINVAAYSTNSDEFQAVSSKDHVDQQKGWHQTIQQGVRGNIMSQQGSTSRMSPSGQPSSAPSGQPSSAPSSSPGKF
jgi:hypothetical protein